MFYKNVEEFNWEKYKHWNGTGLRVNPDIKGQDSKTKVFSHEPYAQDLFNLLNKTSSKPIRKDLEQNDIVNIIDIPHMDNTGKIIVEIMGGLTIDVDLNREKRFMQLFGFDSAHKFISAIMSDTGKSLLMDNGIFGVVTEASPTIKISLWEGHLRKIHQEFMEQINSPSKAYTAKVIQANRGGFFIDVQGIKAFMPGSLAAANKIINFQEYIDREIIVMVEDYLYDMKSFIFSHKKYIDHILPSRLEELDLNEKIEGVITGASKYGIFIEFKEIFTGLLHRSKMSEDTYNKFRNREYSPGDQIEFYIGEITKDNRIILTEESPEARKEKIRELQEADSDSPIKASVAAIMPFGVIINVGDLSGVVPNREFRKYSINTKNLVSGDSLEVSLEEIKEDDKLFFNLWKAKEVGKDHQ